MVLNRGFRTPSCIALGLLASVLLASCGSKGLNSVQVTPATQSVATGQTAQFTAIGTYGSASRPSTQDITSTVTWSSSVPGVATVNASGLATGVSAGTTVITASTNAYNGPVSSSATLVVTGAGGAGAGQLLSVTIIPTSITVGALTETGQFLAIGTYSATPTIRDITNSSTVTWISSFPNDFPVNNNTAGGVGATAGIVTAYASGSAVITVEAKSSDGSLQTATANFSCPLVLPNPPTAPGSCYQTLPFPSPTLSTLTVYNEGLNTTNWLVTAPSATGTPNVINCGPGAGAGKSVCVATYPYGSTVTLTAPANGAAFGGWSSNCTNIGTITATGPNSCTVTLTTDDTVGVIFN
ncbi:MAG: Ig-like domain-containing protein [Acidobacteriaceae bacterium]